MSDKALEDLEHNLEDAVNTLREIKKLNAEALYTYGFQRQDSYDLAGECLERIGGLELASAESAQEEKL